MAHTHIWKNVVPDIYDMLLYNAAKYVCHWDPTFAAEYLAKETSRRQTLQCCHITCCQKAGSSYLSSRKNKSAIHQSRLSLSNSILLFLSTYQRCSFCHAVFKVQRTLTEFKIYLKYISVLYSKNIHFKA